MMTLYLFGGDDETKIAEARLRWCSGRRNRQGKNRSRRRLARRECFASVL